MAGPLKKSKLKILHRIEVFKLPYRSGKYKDKDKLRMTRYNYNKRYYDRTKGRGGGKWTDEEINIVMEHKIPDREISDQLNRSMAAIVTKRYIEIRKRG